MISDFGRQSEHIHLVLEGSAAEAACQGRDRVGVLKIELKSIRFRIQHAALKVAADLRRKRQPAAHAVPCISETAEKSVKYKVFV